MDVLRHFALKVDPTTGTLALAPPPDEPDPQATQLQMRGWLVARPYIAMDLDTDETRWALLDTGATRTHLAPDGLDVVRTLQNAVLRGTGEGGGRTIDLDVLAMPAGEIAGQPLPAVEVLSLTHPKANPKVGLDVVGGHHLWLDFVHGTVRLEPADDPTQLERWTPEAGVAGRLSPR